MIRSYLIKNSDFAREWIGKFDQMTWRESGDLGTGQVIRNADTICNRQCIKQIETERRGKGREKR